MSKKDFELIAHVLREEHSAIERDRPQGQAAYRERIMRLQRLARAFAAELATTNPRFDRERFVAACMGEDSHDSAGRIVRYSS